SGPDWVDHGEIGLRYHSQHAAPSILRDCRRVQSSGPCKRDSRLDQAASSCHDCSPWSAWRRAAFMGGRVRRRDAPLAVTLLPKEGAAQRYFTRTSNDCSGQEGPIRPLIRLTWIKADRRACKDRARDRFGSSLCENTSTDMLGVCRFGASE